MGKLMVPALRAVLAVLLAGSVFVQTVLVPLLAVDLEQLAPSLSYLRVPVVVLVLLGVVAVQVVLVCVWRLVSMVRRGTVFSHGAFRYVHVVIGAIVVAALLLFALTAVLASANHHVPGDAVAPGMILLLCGGVVAVLGVALIVLVLRMLLAQAVAREAEAGRMRAELAGVI
ncbi:DUF2975 domain-containing protein [Saccharomonospora cyanea]|uniref:Transmembrane transport protein n=1 Tax=Saccharomonospora cyanea NA-134 TaxID=882082 RepID=H5XPU7_9PSEU|nr:DUF2975 domain-containing protein [Saccharomonospora cyanea]EHR61176.1 Protein of unknown function (DUF3036) [Saccharomonospora cyanea NA-134]